ncbi:hypothetical protein DM01DRAFT_1336632 [Hesseltinella vesiculosa]|uniref:CBF1-interacting co-repressor CIR N-terminal domain-containing protein n=1 Tax=Hesseltinella vesiculosa TaxID=101127 RepID=A0A1X2GFX7_9FUNG|nr:hypothetical protein DM01DRAFT_1336632 [Hesseltinella vesiculosa]
MNILPHKSWNVYNKKNIEKVQRDEAKAQEEDDAKRQRAILAESQARLQMLRQRAAERAIESGHEPQPTQPIRLFAEEEQNHQNEEALKDKLAQEKKLERQFTMYLDKGAQETDAPWYSKNEYDRYSDKHTSRQFTRKNEQGHNRRKRPAITLPEDPLCLMKANTHDDSARASALAPAKKKYKNSHSPSSPSSHRARSSKSSIEDLRQQRLKREQAEKLRTRKLLYGETPTQGRGYNSQYNRKETELAHSQRHPASKSTRKPYFH